MTAFTNTSLTPCSAAGPVLDCQSLSCTGCGRPPSTLTGCSLTTAPSFALSWWRTSASCSAWSTSRGLWATPRARWEGRQAGKQWEDKHLAGRELGRRGQGEQPGVEQGRKVRQVDIPQGLLSAYQWVPHYVVDPYVIVACLASVQCPAACTDHF